MNKFLASLYFILILASCSNVPETETGEIQILQLLKKAFDSSNKPKRFMDARNLINREQIDAANIPILFVELASGQNGIDALPSQRDKHGSALMVRQQRWRKVC